MHGLPIPIISIATPSYYFNLFQQSKFIIIIYSDTSSEATPPVGVADSPLWEGAFGFDPVASLSRVAAIRGGCHAVTGGAPFFLTCLYNIIKL